MITTETITVEGQDTDRQGWITPKAVLDRLNHIGAVQAASVGQGVDDIPTTHLSWMVMNWKVQILQYPRIGDTVQVCTWAQHYDRLQAYRNFEIKDSDGTLLIRATSVWIAVNPEKGAVLRLTPEIMEPYEPEPEKESFPDFVFPKYRKLELPVLEKMEYTVEESMIDYNGHVHNSDYIVLASRLLGEEKSRAFTDFEITYRKEILPGATVVLEHCRQDQKELVVIREPETGAIHTVLSLW